MIVHKQFAVVQPLLENVRKITKPCTVDVFCGVHCPSGYPKWETVCAYFAKWRKPDAKE